MDYFETIPENWPWYTGGLLEFALYMHDVDKGYKALECTFDEDEENFIT